MTATWTSGEYSVPLAGLRSRCHWMGYWAYSFREWLRSPCCLLLVMRKQGCWEHCEASPSLSPSRLPSGILAVVQVWSPAGNPFPFPWHSSAWTSHSLLFVSSKLAFIEDECRPLSFFSKSLLILCSLVLFVGYKVLFCNRGIKDV